MQEDNEFQEIGKRTSYKVPDGFFEMISERTLQKSKVREQNRRKNLILWRIVVAAASLVALVSLTYFITGTRLKSESEMISENTPRVEQQIARQQPEIVKQPEIAKIKKTSTEKRAAKIIAEEISTEDIGDVLAELSDEELAQLETMYKTDPFINELAQ